MRLKQLEENSTFVQRDSQDRPVKVKKTYNSGGDGEGLASLGRVMPIQALDFPPALRPHHPSPLWPQKREFCFRFVAPG
jgi:hypothetical protein